MEMCCGTAQDLVDEDVEEDMSSDAEEDDTLDSEEDSDFEIWRQIWV